MWNPKNSLRRWFRKAYLWATERLYGRFAWAYDGVTWLVSFGYWSHWREDALNYLGTGSVLELGFGTGSLLINMVQKGLPVIGLELSPQMHRVTARKIRKNSMSIRRVCATAEAIPFPAGAFKNLVVTFPSNYILSAATLSEICRVLDANGRGVVVGLGVRFNSWLLRILTSVIWGRDAASLIHKFTHLAEQAGFRVTQVMHTADAYTQPVVILELGDVD